MYFNYYILLSLLYAILFTIEADHNTTYILSETENLHPQAQTHSDTPLLDL